MLDPWVLQIWGKDKNLSVPKFSEIFENREISGLAEISTAPAATFRLRKWPNFDFDLEPQNDLIWGQKCSETSFDARNGFFDRF